MIAFGLGISACAPINTSQYSVNMRYDPTQSVIPSYLKADEKTQNAIITVAEFNDTRQVDDKIVQWDLKEKTMPKGKGKIIIGGNTEAMEVTCWRGVFSNSYTASVKLNIVFANLAKRKILYTSNMESSSSRDDVSFSEEELGGQLSTALGDAIKKVFEDETVAQKLKEAITQ